MFWHHKPARLHHPFLDEAPHTSLAKPAEACEAKRLAGLVPADGGPTGKVRYAFFAATLPAQRLNCLTRMPEMAGLIGVLSEDGAMVGVHGNSFDPQTLVDLETAFDEACLRSNRLATRL